MGLLDFYRTPKKDGTGQDRGGAEENPEPLPRITMSELWPPSPRVKMLYIGAGFFLFNLLLICIWGYVLATNT